MGAKESRARAPTVLYSYGYNGEQDHDWGCVWRSFQNALHFTGWPVPELAAMLRAARKTAGEWAEPAILPAVGPLGVRRHCRVFLVGEPNADMFHFSSRDQYPLRWASVRAFAVAGILQGCAYVVDDGVSGYAIVPWEGRHWWVDPHTNTPVLKKSYRRLLLQRRGWMVLQVSSAAS